MTAPQRYLTSVNLSFSHFLAKSAISDQVKDEAVLILLDLIEHLPEEKSFDIPEITQLLDAHTRNGVSAQAVKIVTQFVHKFPPHQAGVYLFEYLLSLKNSNCSPSTIKNYRSDINQFIAFSSETNLENLINKPKVVAFLKSQRSKGLKTATIIRKLVSITQFALWAEQEGLLVDSPLVSDQLTALRGNILDDDQAEELRAQDQLPDLDEVSQQAETPKSEHKPKTRDDQTWSMPFSLDNKTGGLLTTGINTGIAKEVTTKAETARSRQDYRARLKSKLSSFSGISEKIKDSVANAPSLLLPYTNLAMMVLFILGLSVFGYQQFIRDASLPFAYPSTPTRPNRTLSFQGRLTDTAQNPVTTATDMRFYLYDSGPSIVGGTQLWDSGTCSVTPDQDGIFAVGLGDDCGSEITSDVFSENANVWLEVEIETETLEPRQSIKSVAYALNSETLQGYPIDATGAATINTVVTMDAGGEIVLGEVSPTIRSVSGTFSIEAQSLLFQTSSGSNGDIVIDPDGTGIVQVLSSLTDFQGYIAAPGATISATYAGGIPLVVRGGPSGTANIQEWQNSSGTVLSSVDENGNIGIGTSDPAAALSIGSSSQFQVNSSGIISAIDGVAHTIDDIGGDLTLTSNSSTVSIADGLSVSGTLAANGDIDLGDAITDSITFTARADSDLLPITDSLYDLGSSSLAWAEIHGDTIYQNGNQVCDLSGNCSSLGNYWRLSSGALSPVNDTTDLLIGSNATASAKFAFINVNTGTPTASISGNSGDIATTLSGTGTLGTTNRQTLTLGSSSTGNLSFAPGGVVAGTFLTNGNFGVGTTAPLQKLHIDGNCVTLDTLIAIRRRKKLGKGNGDDDEEEDEDELFDHFLCRIDQILPGDEVLSLDETTGDLVYSRINKYMDMGIKEIYEVTTKSGRTIRTTAEHPYLTA